MNGILSILLMEQYLLGLPITCLRVTSVLDFREKLGSSDESFLTANDKMEVPFREYLRKENMLLLQRHTQTQKETLTCLVGSCRLAI